MCFPVLTLTCIIYSSAFSSSVAKPEKNHRLSPFPVNSLQPWSHCVYNLQTLQHLPAGTTSLTRFKRPPGIRKTSLGDIKYLWINIFEKNTCLCLTFHKFIAVTVSHFLKRYPGGTRLAASVVMHWVRSAARCSKTKGRAIPLLHCCSFVLLDRCECLCRRLNKVRSEPQPRSSYFKRHILFPTCIYSWTI